MQKLAQERVHRNDTQKRFGSWFGHSFDLNVVLNSLTVMNQDAIIHGILTTLLPMFDFEEVPTEARALEDPVAGALTRVTIMMSATHRQWEG